MIFTHAMLILILSVLSLMLYMQSEPRRRPLKSAKRSRELKRQGNVILMTEEDEARIEREKADKEWG